MTPAEAAKLLELPADATPEQLEARFLDLRRKLEDKIAKAPTPGLQAKYRESLAAITTAFETLALAADGSGLPVLNKQSAVSGQPSTGGPASLRAAPPTAHTPAAKTAKSGGKEFAIVAVIAVAVLGTGGWFVMKTRTETRLAAEAKAATEARSAAEKAEQDRLAEAQRKTTEEEKVRNAATAKAEQDRLDKLTAQLRGELAGFKVDWEAFEKEERNAERRLAELKSDLRSLRDPSAGRLAEAQAQVAAQQQYYDWLSDTLPRHPAKVARSKAEELLSARQPDEASATMKDLPMAINELDKLIRQQREQALDLNGTLVLRTEANVSWSLTDAFERTRSGQGPARLPNVAVGLGRIKLTKPHWPARAEEFHIRRGQAVEINAEHQSHVLKLRSTPDGAEARLADGTVLGQTPLSLDGFPPGTLTLIVHKEGYYDQQVKLTLPSTGPDGPALALKIKPTGLVKPDRWVSPERVTVENRISMSGAQSDNIQLIEEWDLTQRDATVGWTHIVRKFIIYSGKSAQYAPVAGSVLRQQRQADGKWAGNFVQGGLADSSVNYVWAATTPALWQLNFGIIDFWPAGETPVGGTWSVKPELFLYHMGLINATGQVSAKLLSLDRADEVEQAVIEFSYTYVLSGMTGQATLRVQLNLTECYVTHTEGQGTLVHSGSVTNSSYTTTVTKR